MFAVLQVEDVFCLTLMYPCHRAYLDGPSMSDEILFEKVPRRYGKCSL